MITALLAAVFAFGLLYGRVPQTALVAISALVGVILALVSRRGHSHTLSTDALAQSSRLKNVHPALKLWTTFALMIVCVASGNSVTGICVGGMAGVLAVPVGGLPLRRYARTLTLPVMFLLLGGLALLFEASFRPTGIFNINIFGLWLCVNAETQSQTALIISRAFGAVSCLCFLSVTTAMPDIIGVLRQSRCPELVIDLMYLIYRYIFILFSLHHDMRDAAQSRLGFGDYRTSLRTTGKITVNLLGSSYRFAGKNFDAMESRCYDEGIRFLRREYKITVGQIAASAAIFLLALGLSLLPLRG